MRNIAVLDVLVFGFVLICKIIDVYKSMLNLKKKKKKIENKMKTLIKLKLKTVCNFFV